ncbi:inositol monophosphatase, partial [Arthrobacter sp. JCM 19049]|uniref:inositol monophosphatase family protein n=1 Tax=Arthrobacter sp. JCM 19049 TaxID=1460643 RepID=UPI000A861A7D
RVLGVDEKSAAGDWVTDFDRSAEEAIRAAIITTRPNDALTGEEFGSHTPAKPSGYRWSIDHWMGPRTSCAASTTTPPPWRCATPARKGR